MSPPPEFLPEELRRLDPAWIIEQLEPHVLESRRQRICEVIERRIGNVTVLFDAPYDPHNGAAVMRSCEAFGVGSLHVVERQKPFVLAKTVARGTERWVEVNRYQEPAAAAVALKQAGFTLVGAEADGALLPRDLPSIPRLCLVMGNEHDGIAAALRAACEQHVRVPMRGFVESLNVSVTSAILLAAATDGRHGDLELAERQRLYARALWLSMPHAEAIVRHHLEASH